MALLVCLFTGAVHAAPLTPAEVPEPLKPWVPWVLRDVEAALCPYEPATMTASR